MLKRVLKWIAIVAIVVLVGVGGFVAYNAWAFSQEHGEGLRRAAAQHHAIDRRGGDRARQTRR